MTNEKKYDIIREVNQLTGNSLSDLTKFEQLLISIMGHCVLECKEEDIPITHFTSGIGDFGIKVDGDVMSFSFTPSHKLAKTLKTTIQTGSSPLVKQAGDSLEQNILLTYKGLL